MLKSPKFWFLQLVILITLIKRDLLSFNVSFCLPRVLLFLYLQLNLLPYVCGVREGFINNFLRLLDRKALAMIKYLEAKSYV